MPAWTFENVKQLDTQRVQNLRTNALNLGNEEVAHLCDEVLLERNVINRRPKRHIVELHYHCPNRLNLKEVEGGRFRSGNWVIAEQHCDPAIQHGAILALHTSRSAKSFFQGKVVAWETAPPEKGPNDLELHRAIFVVEPTSDPLEWVGDATGERGYKWSDD